MVLIPGWGRSPGGGHSNPLQYSCLGNPKRSLVGYSPWGHKNWTMTATKPPPPPPHIWFTMLYRFQHIVYSIVIQYFFRLCSILGYCKIIDTTPWLCSISLSVYFICSSLCLLIPYLCPSLLFSLLWWPQVCVLYLWVCFRFAYIFTCIIF